MQYALLVYTRPGMDDGLSEAELQELTMEYYAFREVPG